MATNFVQKGAYIDYTPGGAVASGELLQIGGLYGVAQSASVGPTEPIAVSLEGVYEVPKTAGGGTALTVGAPAYYDVSAGAAVSGDDEAAANPLCGHAVEDAADGDETAKVRLIG